MLRVMVNNINEVIENKYDYTEKEFKTEMWNFYNQQGVKLEI